MYIKNKSQSEHFSKKLGRPISFWLCILIVRHKQNNLYKDGYDFSIFHILMHNIYTFNQMYLAKRYENKS